MHSDRETAERAERSHRFSPARAKLRLPALLLPAIAGLVLACGAPAPLGEIELFEEANREFESGQFTLATTHYEELLEQHPFSDLAEIARLRIAHAYYLNGNYDKAIAAFSDFERLHPASQLMPFVEYTIAMAYLDQVRPVDRDKSAAENALRQFERVGIRYPDSLYGRLAEFRTLQCRETLASHELVIGDYYRRVGKTPASLSRYQYLVENYPETDAAVLGRQRLAELPASGRDDEPAP